jgi:hypothetical protein
MRLLPGILQVWTDATHNPQAWKLPLQVEGGHKAVLDEHAHATPEPSSDGPVPDIEASLTSSGKMMTRASSDMMRLSADG